MQIFSRDTDCLRVESVVFHSTEAEFPFPDLLSCRKRQTNMGKIQRTGRRTKANADKIKHIGRNYYDSIQYSFCPSH